MLQTGLTTLCARLAHVTRTFCALLTLIRLHVLTVVREVETVGQAKAAPLGYELIEAGLENRIAALIRRVMRPTLSPTFSSCMAPASMPKF